MKNKSLFIEFFGDYPLIRVLDFLIENEIFDYSKKEIAKEAGVSRNTLESIWKRLEENQAIKKSRRIGKAQLYKLNAENPVVQKLLEIDKKLMLRSIEEIKKEETIKKP